MQCIRTIINREGVLYAIKGELAACHTVGIPTTDGSEVSLFAVEVLL